MAIALGRSHNLTFAKFVPAYRYVSNYTNLTKSMG